MVDYETAMSLVENGGYRVVLYEGQKHYAKLLSSDGNFIEWVQKLGGRKRRESSKFSLVDIMKYHELSGEPFCFICGRSQSELGVGEGLEIDHIVPVREGGQDKIGNLQILCSACHKHRHWAELYITKHLVRKQKLTDFDEKNGDIYQPEKGIIAIRRRSQ